MASQYPTNNIFGTLYLADEKGLDVVKYNLSVNPPPIDLLNGGRMICVDMDETTDELEKLFPNHCMKATLLCPPPSAMYKEIDGDEEGFIREYNAYLDTDQSVQEFIAVMLLFMHVGGNIMLYSPALIEDGAVWLNTLVMFFYTRYGITIGTPTSSFAYDNRYDDVIDNLLYDKNCIGAIEYCNCNPSMDWPSSINSNKLYYELSRFCGPGETPYMVYSRIKRNIFDYGVPIFNPGVIFVE